MRSFSAEVLRAAPSPTYIDAGSRRSYTTTFRVPLADGRWAELMLPGPSTVVTRAVIEDFAPRFLRQPAVIFLSESGNKVVARDDDLATSIGLRLDYSRNLPDIILADVHAEAPKVVFIEVIATDGPVTAQRKVALLEVAKEAGLRSETVYFLSAFTDRGAPVFRKLVSELAWGTFAWVASEPDRLLVLREADSAQLAGLFSY